MILEIFSCECGYGNRAWEKPIIISMRACDIYTFLDPLQEWAMCRISIYKAK